MTEAAALSASRWIGLGKKNDADGAAVEAMREAAEPSKVGKVRLSIAVVLFLAVVPLIIYNVVQLSYRIALIPDGLQGRVNSSFRLFAFGQIGRAHV